MCKRKRKEELEIRDRLKLWKNKDYKDRLDKYHRQLLEDMKIYSIYYKRPEK